MFNSNELPSAYETLQMQQQQQKNKSDLNVSTQKWLSLSDPERSSFLYQKRRDTAYKTSLCRYWRNHNFCNYGEQCRFAHGVHELLAPPPPHPKHKTQLCKNYIYDGYCEYGARCQFIHRPMTVSSPPPRVSPPTSSVKMSYMPMPPATSAYPTYASVTRSSRSFPTADESRPSIQQPQAGASVAKVEDVNALNLKDIFAEWDKSVNAIQVGHSSTNSDTSDDFHFDEFASFDKRFIH